MTTVSVPWAAWHGDCQIELTFPPLWDVIEAQMQDAPALDDEAIRERLCTPIGTPPLRVLAQGRSSAIIVIDDTSRPTPVHRLMPQVLAELEAGGIRKDQICILIGSASHRPTTRLDSIKKLGQDIVETIEVRNHNPYENLANLGASSRGTPIFINNTFVQGDLKIAVGCIVPHEMAGFGGGAKVVGVGVAGVETLDYNHQQVASEGPVGLDLLKGNACREDIEEIALRAGLEMTIDVVVNSGRDVAGVFAGHPVQAHREGAEYARQVYTTPLPESVDVGVFNAYPKDTELLLGFNALNVGYGIVFVGAGIGAEFKTVPAMQDIMSYGVVHGIGTDIRVQL